MRTLIREVIVSSGVPAVLVTHDAEEAEELGDAVIAYEDGRVTGRRIVERPVRPEPQRGTPESTESADPMKRVMPIGSPTFAHARRA